MTNYPNRYPDNAAKGYRAVARKAGDIVDTAEENEADALLHAQDVTIGNESLGTISVRSGCSISVNRDAGEIIVDAGRVWCGGYVHVLERSTLTIPMEGTVEVGVAVAVVNVTYEDDVDLLGQVENTPGFGRPLSDRERHDAVWATSGDPFYPIATIVDGSLLKDIEPPISESMESLVERHIRESHGSHLVEGMGVRWVKAEAGKQYLSVASGLVRANGVQIKKSVDTPFNYDELPTERTVNGEVHYYVGSGEMPITLNNGPIAAVDVLTVDKRVTKTITHTTLGGSDPLPNTPVVAIESITQGGTTFDAGDDYALDANLVDWSGAVKQPDASSSYDVTFIYTDTIDPISVDRQVVRLDGGYDGGQIRVNYRYNLPRIDILSVDSTGVFTLLRGVPSKYNVKAPRVPTDLTPLVRITNQWGIAPIIEEVGQQALHELELQSLKRMMLVAFDQISQTQLQAQAAAELPAAQTGWFWDNFTDETQRDLGQTNTAACFDGLLQLPITVSQEMFNLGSVITLPYVSEVVLENDWRTMSLEINEFDVFNPAPGLAVLDPAVDRWNEVITEDLPTVRTQMMVTSGTSRVETSEQLISSQVTQAEFLRQLEVSYTLSHFGPGETLQAISFDGLAIDLPPDPVADGNGQITGSFVIPANVPSGTKQVYFRGAETDALGVFSGEGIITTQSWQATINTITRLPDPVVVEATGGFGSSNDRDNSGASDPIGQSFSLAQDRIVLGFSVEFATKGNEVNHVIGVLRLAESDLPVGDPLAEGIISGDFTVSSGDEGSAIDWTRIDFRQPVPVLAANKYASILLTDDPDHAVSVAQLGDANADPDNPNAIGFDRRKQQFVTQNVLGGQLIQSPNNDGYVLEPDKDLTIQIHAARFTATSHRQVIASLDLVKVSDLHVRMGIYDFGALTAVELELVRAGGEVIRFEPNEHLMLDEYLTETVELAMVLTGTETVSPIVQPQIQVLLGTLEEEGVYTGQAIEVDVTSVDANIRPRMDIQTPGDSAVAVTLQNGASFVSTTPDISKNLGSDWWDRGFKLEGFDLSETRAQITLTGDPANRPYVRKLRVRATEQHV